MPRRKPRDEQVVRRVERDSVHRSDAASRLREQQKMRQTLVRRPGRRPARGEERADRFHMGSLIPKFLKSVRKRLDSSWLYQSFKLPGTSYIVRDLRSKGRSKQAKTGGEGDVFESQNSRLTEAKDKSYINYLADRHNLRPEAMKDLQQEITRLLSEFEKLLVERFEKGKVIAQKSEDGKPHFRPKTVSQWRSFFAKFFKRSIWKKSEIRMLKEFIFRGLVSLKKGGGKYALLIGDMLMQNGDIQKFTRLRVLSELMEMLAKMEPGSTLEAELVKKGIEADEFRYLALAHKHGEQAFKTGAEATKGIFGQLRTEEQVAKQLGIKKRKGFKGPIKWGEEGDAEEKHAFVPWGFWERQKRGGWPRVAIGITFLIMIFLVILAVLAIVRSF